MTQIETQKVLRNNYNLGFARLVHSAILGLLLTTLVIFAAEMAFEIVAYVQGAKSFEDFAKWLQYTHIVVMVVCVLTVLISLILGICGCYYLSKSDSITNSQVATYVFFFLFTGFFIGLCVIVAVFDQVKSLQDIIPNSAQPYLLGTGGALVLAACICSIILAATTRQKKVKVVEVKKGENQKVKQPKAEAKKPEEKKEAKKAKKQAKKAKKAAKKTAKKAKKQAPAQTNKTNENESINSMLMSENAELREELEHLKRSRSAEKGWVSRKDDKVEDLEKDNAKLEKKIEDKK